MKVYDEDGNPTDIPVDNLDEIATHKEEAGKVAGLNEKVEELGGNDDYQGLRKARTAAEVGQKAAEEKVKRIEALAKEKGISLEVATDEDNKDHKNEAQLTPEQVKELGEQGAQKVFQDRVEDKKAGMIEKASRGDENRKKAIEAEYKVLYGDTKVNTEEDMKLRIDKVNAIISSTSDMAESINPLDKINTDGMGGGAPKFDPKKESSKKAIEHLKGMGYEPKSKKLKDAMDNQ